MAPPSNDSKAPVDLLVIGGGINGAGIALDAAIRGLSVVLVEKNDWGWGTSSKSSMLAHGGLRYLEQLELGLVHEALQDRELMLQHAPHLVRPLRFLYPLYPHIANRHTVRAGLFVYDMLSYGKSVPQRDHLNREECLQAIPQLNPEGLDGAATYFDAQIRSVERLVAELVWDAKREGADCRNHTEVVRLLVEDGVCVGAELRGPDGAQSSVRASAVLNATGTWVDEVLSRGVQEQHGPLIRKTKGVHLVLPRFLDDALIVRAAQDGRTFFFIPWKEHTLVGTTDTDYEGDSGDAAATAEDVEYLLEAAREYFPEVPLDVVYTYAGVRPLVHESDRPEGHVTRRHVLHDHARDGAKGLWSVQGGKITTYRHLAEEAVSVVCKHLGRSKDARLHPTRDRSLPGGPLIPWAEFRASAVMAAQQEFGIHTSIAQHLVDTYGARWRQVLECGHDSALLKRVQKGRPHLWANIFYAVHEEQAKTVADVMLRRTDLGLAADGNVRTARAVARRMADWLDWDSAQMQSELADYEGAIRVLAIPEVH